MTQELTKNLMCVCLYGEIELWIESERVQGLMRTLTKPTIKFVEIDGEVFNPNQIIGIFTPKAMEARTRRRNGEWQCGYSKWHPKGQKGLDEHEACKPRKDHLPLWDGKDLKELA